MPNKASKKGQKGKGKRPRGTSDGGEDGEDDSPQRRKEEREERRSKKAASIREEKGTPFGGGGMKFSEAFTKILKTAEQVVGQARRPRRLAPPSPCATRAYHGLLCMPGARIVPNSAFF